MGKIIGIPVGIDYSWFLIFALLTWLLATSYYPAEFSKWPVIQYWIVGGVTVILLFASVLLHELGHSVVALRYKVPVRRITLFIFGGVSEITTEPPNAMAEFWIAIAGPVVSFLLAILFALLEPVFSHQAPLLALAKYLSYINLALGIFNLLPGFPLDGGRVFRAIVWGIAHNFRRATFVAANVGRLFAFLFILGGVWMIFTGNVGNGIWIAFTGWFLDSAASAQIRQQNIHDLLGDRRVMDAMRHDYTVVDPGTTLEQLVTEHILGIGRRNLIVEQNGMVLGMLTLHEIKKIARPDWPNTIASQIMIPMEKLKWVSPTTELIDALGEMDRDGVSQLPVMVNGQIQGILGRDDVINFLRTISEFSARKK